MLDLIRSDGLKPLVRIGRPLTIGDVLDSQAERIPAGEALVYIDRKLRYTYQRFREGCDRVARGLLRIGLGRGQRIGLWTENLPEAILLAFAAAKVGGAVVALGSETSSEEILSRLKTSQAKGLAIGFAASLDWGGTIRELFPEIEECPRGQLHAERCPQLRALVHLGDERLPGVYGFKDLIDLAEQVSRPTLLAAQRDVRPGDGALVEWTGANRRALRIHDHQGALEAVAGMKDRLRMGEGRRVFQASSISASLFDQLVPLASAVSGATLTPLVGLEPQALLSALAAKGAAAVVATPTQWTAVLSESAGEAGLPAAGSGVAAVISGLSRPADLAARLAARWPELILMDAEEALSEPPSILPATGGG
jgi:fatty-acyl-CoA synthase